MIRRVKFSLNMPSQKNIRDLEALRNNFNLKNVLIYYLNGKLLTWLKDRNYNDYANKLVQMDKNDYANLKKNIYDIFDISEESILTKDDIAFSQSELMTLLKDNTQQIIYLYGEIFTIPVQYRNKIYIGINRPKVRFVRFTADELATFGIFFYNVHLPTFFPKNTDV